MTLTFLPFTPEPYRDPAAFRRTHWTNRRRTQAARRWFRRYARDFDPFEDTLPEEIESVLPDQFLEELRKEWDEVEVAKRDRYY